MIQCEINALQVTDYATFGHKDDSLMVEHGRFRIETIPKIQPLLQSNIRLRLAFNKTEMESLKRQLDHHTYSGEKIQITSNSLRVAKILNDELRYVSSSIKLVDSYIASLDNHCKKRYKWAEVKGKLVFQHLEEINKGSD